MGIGQGLLGLNRDWIPPKNADGWNAPVVPTIPVPPAEPIWGGMPPDSACPGGTAEPTLNLSFEGIPDPRNVIPPDTMGAVGPDHVVTHSNSDIRIYSRTGQAPAWTTMTAFWRAAGAESPCDPKISFDQLSGRWIAACIECGNLQNSRMFLGVSATSNPTGTWRFWSFRSDLLGGTWADYPQFGMNQTWIAMTANMFPTAGGPPVGSKMWVIDKSTVLTPGVLKIRVFWTGFDGGDGWKGFTIQPCVTFDSGEQYLYLADSNLLNGTTPALRISRITGTGPAPVWEPVPGSNTGVGGAFINGLPPINPRGVQSGKAEQRGETRGLEAIGSRLLNAVYRNGRIWAAYDAFLPETGDYDRIGAGWVQLDPMAMPSPVVQAGIIEAGSHTYHIYPSIAVNCANDVVIGFTRTDPTRYPEGAYTTRLATDVPGTMRAVRLLKEGVDSYHKTFGGTRNRWGDYSATVVDPRDDLSFWTVQEYAMARGGGTNDYGRWGTWWGWLQVKRTGDCNCDGVANTGDINSFVLALSDPQGYQTTYPDCNWQNADCNLDGLVDFNDINAFVGRLSR
ncbi:MAG: hypothetical protein AB1716_06455 [Planctomycetota bacterium]